MKDSDQSGKIFGPPYQPTVPLDWVGPSGIGARFRDHLGCADLTRKLTEIEDRVCPMGIIDLALGRELDAAYEALAESCVELLRGYFLDRRLHVLTYWQHGGQPRSRREKDERVSDAHRRA